MSPVARLKDDQPVSLSRPWPARLPSPATLPRSARRAWLLRLQLARSSAHFTSPPGLGLGLGLT
eukprot:10974825-Alexandrium_andersonii.AAC.1